MWLKYFFFISLLFLELFDDTCFPGLSHAFGGRSLTQLKGKTFDVFIKFIYFMDMSALDDIAFITRDQSLHYFVS